MLKRALTNTIGAFALAVAAVLTTIPMAPSARADWTCDNCDCKCGRCHTPGQGIYCCPCVKSNSTSENSSRRPKAKTFQPKVNSFHLGPSGLKTRGRR
jgi:hypothetical protein